MVTTDQVYILDVGDPLILECEFEADYFTLFDNPVLWIKQQLEEETLFNILGNLNDPYSLADRFDVSITQMPPIYQLELAIRELRPEDSGNYSCEVRGRDARVIGSVTHKVFIRAPVIFTYVTNQNQTVYDLQADTMTFTENQASILQCISYGGYPPPDILLYIGSRDITDHMTVSLSANMGGEPGLKLMSFTTTRWTSGFIAKAEDDNKNIQCIVRVPGWPAKVTSVHVDVNYGPRITCQLTKAYLGDKNVHLQCEVRAKPSVSALFWIIDQNGTTVSEGEIIQEHWTLIMDRSDGMLEAQLFLHQTTDNSFNSYTLVAENEVAMATQQVQLIQRYRTSSRHGSKSTKPGLPQPRDSDSNKYTLTTDNGANNCDCVSYILMFLSIWMFLLTL